MLGMAMMMGGRPTFNVNVSSNGGTFQLSVDAPTIPSNVPVLVILRVLSATERQSASTSLGGLIIDGLASGSEVQLINEGYLLGMGGAGGPGGASGSNGTAGSAGGPAIRADFTGNLFITNNSGRIWGGGGGAGGGGGNDGGPARGGGGGGGGAGGGAGAIGGSPGGGTGSNGTTGSAGTGGAGGTSAGAGAGDGGDGQGYGVAGATGDDGTSTSGAAGGAAGYAILHNAGTIVTFISGQSSPNVKGSITS
jgi:hypothetical protein